MYGILPDDTSSRIFSQHARASPRGNASRKKKKDKVRLSTRHKQNKAVITGPDDVTQNVTDVTQNVTDVTQNVTVVTSSVTNELGLKDKNRNTHVTHSTKKDVERHSENENNGTTMVINCHNNGRNNGRNNGNNNGKQRNTSTPWRRNTIVSKIKDNVKAITDNVTNRLKTRKRRPRNFLFLANAHRDEINNDEINISENNITSPEKNNNESENKGKNNANNNATNENDEINNDEMINHNEININTSKNSEKQNIGTNTNQDDGSSVPELVTRYTHDGDSTVSSTERSRARQDELDIDDDRCSKSESRYNTSDDNNIIQGNRSTKPTINNITAERLRGGYESDASSDTDSISQYSNNDGVESTVRTTPSDEHERRNEPPASSKIPSTINIIKMSDETKSQGYRRPVDNHTIVTQITDSTDKRQYHTPDKDGDTMIYHVNHADAIGGNLVTEKQEGHIRISGCNPNGIKAHNLQSHLQHSKDLDIDIQGYSEVNTNFVLNKTAQAFYELPKRMDPTSRPTWCSSAYECEGAFKPGGTGIVTSGPPASRIKETRKDPLGRWTCQVLDGEKDKDVAIICIYQCCTPAKKTGMKTAYKQQKVLLSQMNRRNTDPRTNFKLDLKQFVKDIQKKYKNIRPIIIGDWNEECRGTAASMEMCHEFGLVNIFERMHPEHENFNTYNRGSSIIDFALAPPEIADIVSNFVYEPFFYRLKGDHRGFYFDIPEKALFGSDTPAVYDSKGRGLNSKDIKNVKVYLETVQEYLIEHKVFARVHELTKSHRPNFRELEKIDKIMTKACEVGESKCTRKGKSYWSMDLHTTKRDLSIWCTLRSWVTRELDTSALIHRAQEVGVDLVGATEETAIERIQELRSKLRDIHKKSADKRQEMLLNQANFADDVDDKTKVRYLRNIRRSEKQARAFSQLKYRRERTNTSGGINRLEIPSGWPTMEEYDDDVDYNLIDPKKLDKNDPSVWRQINCSNEIEFYLRLRNQRHFGQAETDTTPFTTKDRKEEFDWAATTVSAEEVLKGTYINTTMTEVETLFVNNLSRVRDQDESKRIVTYEEFSGKMRVWRESTSTSPSGRHLGHYKALVSTIDRSLPQEEQDKLYDIQKDIARVYIAIINYCIRHRYSLDRWKTIVNMMIYKEPGNVKIHRLRVIHLYEADLGLVWGAKWGASMRAAVRERTLHQGQFGGLPGRDCTSLTFFEEIRYDYSAITRYPFTNFDNDATACYDRILCSIASICGIKYGIHRDVVFVHAKTLEEAEFKLKTSKRISSTSYKHCTKFPIHGTGQGSTNSPIIWCFISSVAFTAHEQKAHGMLFASPDNSTSVRINMVGFVDDSTCITGGDADTSYSKIKDMMKEDAQLWHDLLWITGGKLELPKCGYHVIYYDFDADGIPYMRHTEQELITLVNEIGTDVDIKGKNIYTPRTNLGHKKSPAGNRQVQAAAIAEKASRLTRDLLSCGCDRHDTKMLFRSVWKPAVEYTLAQSFLHTKQLDKIQRQNFSRIFAKCGYNRNTAKAIMHGPIDMAGGGFTPLRVTAGSGYVIHFLKNWRTGNEIIGKTMRIVYTWYQSHAGITFPLLEQPQIKLPYLQGTVIPAIRSYLSEINAVIRLDNNFIQPILRENDQSIMDMALSITTMTGIQLKRVNAVREYFNITYVSEISTPNGRSLISGIDNGRLIHQRYHPTKRAPKQSRPGRRSFDLWRKVLSKFTRNQSMILATPLGAWTQDHSTNGIWTFYESDNKVFEYVTPAEITVPTEAASVHKATDSDDQTNTIDTSIKHWNIYVKHGSTLSLNHQCVFNDFDPTEAVPIHITKLSNSKLGFESTSIVETAIPMGIDPGTSTLNDLISIQPQWIQELLPVNEIHYPEQDYTPEDIMDIHGEKDSPNEGLLVVSDGSVKVNNMAHGWVIADHNGKQIICGAGAAQGKGSSLRAEGYGMLAATVLMTLIGELTHRKDICIHRISDNEELINRCKAHQLYKDAYPNATITGEYDITEQIVWTTRKHEIRGSYSWVKGHQDDNTTAELSIEALLNIEADRLAGDFQDQEGKNRPLVTA